MILLKFDLEILALEVCTYFKSHVDEACISFAIANSNDIFVSELIKKGTIKLKIIESDFVLKTIIAQL